jgi:hypothetical protein
MQFAHDLYLVDIDDTIEVVCELPSISFDVVIKLLPGKITHDNHRKLKTIDIDHNSLVLISVDQGLPNRNGNTVAEIYIKNKENLLLLDTFVFTEPTADLRKTKTYALAEYLAKRIADKYDINWEYKLSIDSPEKEKSVWQGLLIMLLIWAVMIAVGLICYFNK